MARAIETVYQEIAEAIDEALDGPWVQAWINMTFDEDSGEFEFQYRPTPGAPPVSFARAIEPKATELFLRFSELKDAFDKTSKKPVRGAKFTMEKSGKFKIEFSYS